MPSLPSRKQLFVNTLKVHQAAYEATRGLVGHRILLGMPALMLPAHHRAQVRTHPHQRAGLRPGRQRLLVCASNGGHRKPPAWLLNLEASPDVEVQVGVRRRPATAVALRPGDDDYERLFAICNRANRGQFAAYRKMTERPLPVVGSPPLTLRGGLDHP